MNRKTGLDTTDYTRYHRDYYHRYLSKRARAEAHGEAYVDGRKSREKRPLSLFAKAFYQLRKSAKNRRIPVSPDLTSAWLREQFNRQRARCYYTGIRFSDGGFRGMRNPSIDRIDSGKGYEPGNVVWCLCAVNYAKNDYDAAEFLELLDDIARHR